MHHYGSITRVATDGELAAITMQNPAYSFFYYDATQAVVYSSFGAADKALVDVVDGQAVVVFGGDAPRLTSFDLLAVPEHEQPAAPGTLDVTLPKARSGVDSWRALSSLDGRMLMSDGDQLYLIDLSARGTVAPLEIARTRNTICNER